MAKAPSLADAVSTFGAGAKAKLANPAIRGAPEDQLRAPLEAFVKALAPLGGVGGAVDLVGEAALSHLALRPDYAVSVSKALVGFIEVKAPGKGADPRKFADPHDKKQWSKLKALPNLLYTDGASFSLWRNGEPAGKIVALDGDLHSAGAKLRAPDALTPLLGDFLTWAPQPPRNAKGLAEVAARLCRLLRDEVLEQIELGDASLAALAQDWRDLLFPNASDDQFADGYAQAVTFGLLIARAFHISLADGLELAAPKLKKSNSLIGTALSLLTENDETQKALATSLQTMTRVFDAVNWGQISADKDAWLNFYEDFLEVYDNRLRKLTGSYYTPPEVVGAMVRLVDEALRGPLFERAAGIASKDVTVADPAVGTGTFLLGVMRQIAANVEADQGAGAVHGELLAAMKRLFGFELQFGPFAVAQLRVIAEWRALASVNEEDAELVKNLRLYITDTLDNPFVEDEHLPQVVEAVAKSRREANRMKRKEPITVVIGNPPYKEKAEGRGGWIEKGSDGHPAPLDYWKAPKDWKIGAHGKHLKNLYVYFWRWAALKVFGSGIAEATTSQVKDEDGLICFITVAGFLNGPGFERMRDDLRRTCTAIWVIDCSPEGHQPEVSTRVFEGVQHPVCIVLAARRKGETSDKPAKVRFRALPAGKRKDKFSYLSHVTLTDAEWQDCPNDWRAPFLPEAKGLWGAFPRLASLFAYSCPGVMPGRTWVIAPDKETLIARWDRLKAEKDATKKEILFHPQLRNGMVASRHIRKIVEQDLGRIITRRKPILQDKEPSPEPVRYGFRSLDRQWLIGDARVLNDPRPQLWAQYSNRQVAITGLDAHSPTNGPAITISSLIPDQHHYKGSFGGRVYPLWADARATQPNIKTQALHLLAKTYGAPVGPEDLFAYMAGVMAHPAFTARFAADLIQPGLRLPLTAVASLFAQAAALGREVIWLHSYGERFADPKAGRPKAPPRMPKGQGPVIPAKGAIPPAPAPLPDTMDHDPATNRLHVGAGYVDNVSKAMWDYEVSGKQVLWHWFSYRKADRSRPIIGDRRPPSPLEKIQPEGWLADYTSDLLNLLHVLGRVIALEPAQAGVLDAICAGPLISLEALRAAGLVEAPGSEDEPVS